MAKGWKPCSFNWPIVYYTVSSPVGPVIEIKVSGGGCLPYETIATSFDWAGLYSFYWNNLRPQIWIDYSGRASDVIDAETVLVGHGGSTGGLYGGGANSLTSSLVIIRAANTVAAGDSLQLEFTYMTNGTKLV